MTIRHELLADESLLIAEPQEPLREEDFRQLAEKLDPYIETHGPLRGLMIHTEKFPGWDDFAGFLAHLRFVKEHHRQVRKVAAVTDSPFLSIAPRLAQYFVQAEIRKFDFADKEAALAWLRDRTPPAE